MYDYRAGCRTSIRHRASTLLALTDCLCSSCCRALLALFQCANSELAWCALGCLFGERQYPTGIFGPFQLLTASKQHKQPAGASCASACGLGSFGGCQASLQLDEPLHRERQAAFAGPAGVVSRLSAPLPPAVGGIAALGLPD